MIDLKPLLKSASAIKLKGGIFTTASHVLIVLILSVTVTVCFANNIWITGGALLLLSVVVLIVISKLINLAIKNPQAVIYLRVYY